MNDYLRSLVNRWKQGQDVQSMFLNQKFPNTTPSTPTNVPAEGLGDPNASGQTLAGRDKDSKRHQINFLQKLLF